jgi:hypothetical protein
MMARRLDALLLNEGFSVIYSWLPGRGMLVGSCSSDVPLRYQGHILHILPGRN